MPKPSTVSRSKGSASQNVTCAGGRDWSRRRQGYSYLTGVGGQTDGGRAYIIFERHAIVLPSVIVSLLVIAVLTNLLLLVSHGSASAATLLSSVVEYTSRRHGLIRLLPV